MNKELTHCSSTDFKEIFTGNATKLANQLMNEQRVLASEKVSVQTYPIDQGKWWKHVDKETTFDLIKFMQSLPEQEEVLLGQMEFSFVRKELREAGLIT